MGSLSIGAAQQTVLRLLEGQETYNGKCIIHTRFVGKAILVDLEVDGWLRNDSMKIWI